MGSRATAFLRDPDAEQRVLPGSRGGDAGILRAVSGGAGIAKPGRIVAALPGVAGTRVRRGCRTAVYARRRSFVVGVARGIAQAGRSVGAQPAGPDQEAVEAAALKRRCALFRSVAG